MELFPLSSSILKSYGWEVHGYVQQVPGPGYSREPLGLLTIEFMDGTTYHYSRVPEHVFEEFLMADSKGSYFVKNIRGVYAFLKAEVER